MVGTWALLAWLEPEDAAVKAAFVAAGSDRPPATRRCGSPEEARQWVEDEAAAVGVPVTWTEAPRGG